MLSPWLPHALQHRRRQGALSLPPQDPTYLTCSSLTICQFYWTHDSRFGRVSALQSLSDIQQANDNCSREPFTKLAWTYVDVDKVPHDRTFSSDFGLLSPWRFSCRCCPSPGRVQVDRTDCERWSMKDNFTLQTE